MRSIFQNFVGLGAVAVLGVSVAQKCWAAVPSAGSGSESGMSNARCERLKELPLVDVTIRAAQTVAAGQATVIPEVIAQAKAMPMFPFLTSLAKAPDFCRVAGSIKPTPDSDIKFEVWMPMSGWNGKFQGLAEGGYAGFIDYADLTTSLKRGYATASTDTGHDTGMMSTEWAFNHPEKTKDFNFRGMHLTAVAAKAIITSFYGARPQRSYLSGCSNGGRQALMEAQRFPEDYDGILAGAPAKPVPDIARNVWLAQVMTRDPAGALSPTSIQILHDAAVKKCDMLDGLADGIISDPFHCHFDPSLLLCKGAETNSCLTQPQIDTSRKFYAGLKGPDGKSLHDNLLPGTELSWAAFLTPTPAHSLGSALGVGWYQNFVYNDRTWTIEKFDLNRDVKLLIENSGPDSDPNNPDLSALKARGGKLIIFQGLSDALVPADGTVTYYHSVQEKMSPATADSVAELFLIPGMDHCGNGDAPNDFNRANGVDPASIPESDMSAALENWVEKDIPPQKIVARQYKPTAGMNGPAPDSTLVRTRPLCPYPKVARWTGKGSSDDAANFVCSGPPRAKSG